MPQLTFFQSHNTGHQKQGVYKPMIYKLFLLVNAQTSRNGRSCVYAINIKCPISMYDICFEPSKTIVEFTDWDPIIQCLAQAIQPVLGIASLPSGSYIGSLNI